MDPDILIIGGGPLLGSRVLILEKARYPRPKLCAGALGHHAYHLSL